MEIRVVPDEMCPGCGKAGRTKICNEDDTWEWKCYTPDCKVGYYNPVHQTFEYRLSDEEAAEIAARTKAEVDAMMEGKEWVRVSGDDNGIQTFELKPKK